MYKFQADPNKPRKWSRGRLAEISQQVASQVKVYGDGT
jgi:hypothetical protein